LEFMQQGMVQWRGRTVTVSRWLSRFGFEITCSAGDAAGTFDLLLATGQQHGLVLAGQAAVDLLMLEQGALVAGLDFPLLRDAEASEPSAASLDLTAEGLSARAAVGIEWDGDGSEMPRFVFSSPVAAVRTQELNPGQNGSVGEMLRCAWSPALHRMIGLAMIDRAFTAPGTQLYLQRIGVAGVEDIPARVVARPFLR
jgi:glycine cleavage system aminomethyltransferase T